jgi:hypothetical protein
MLRSMTEAEAAEWWRARGLAVMSHRGRHWKQTRPGFLEPIHWLARLTRDEASCPPRMHWGFRATLDEPGSAAANAALALHLLSDVAGYTLERFPAKRRFHVRKAHKLARFEVLEDPRLLHEQGYAVYRSARERIRSSVLSEPDYHARLDDPSLGPRAQHILAGVVDGALAAYLTAFAVEGTAYIENVHLATEFMSASIGSGLIYEFVQTCRGTERIDRIVYGPHVPDAPALGVFKEGMGFPVQRIPSRMWIAPLVRTWLRRRHPHAYYMITGESTVPAPAPAELDVGPRAEAV